MRSKDSEFDPKLCQEWALMGSPIQGQNSRPTFVVYSDTIYESN